VKEVIDYLQSCFDGYGWITGKANIEVIHFDQSKPDSFCPPGDEHLHIFAVSSKQVANWISDGIILSGKVLLVRTRCDLDTVFAGVFEKDYESFSPKFMQEIYDSKAETLVFYCQGGSKYSPDVTKEYHQWLRKNYPESKQRCLILENGIFGLYDYMEENGCTKEDLDKLFRSTPRVLGF
jgi:hypothetical protein